MKLSILIPTIPQRSNFLMDLYSKLIIQCSKNVEIIVLNNEIDNISVKRNKLLKMALGDYCVWLDDDDLIPDYYIGEVLNAIQYKPDCVGYWNECYLPNKCMAKHSNSVSSWHKKDDVYYRCISFLNPVKKEILLKVPFDEKLTVFEDRKHSIDLKPYLKKEIFIDKSMYYYYPKTSRKLK